MSEMSVEDQKPVITEPSKTSMEILSELFSTFDAEPPLIIKKEKDESKKHKKSKKKHKHKDKKHKKKDKKRKRADSSSGSEIDLAELLIKQERQSPDKKIKLQGDVFDIKNESDTLPKQAKPDEQTKQGKILIKNIKLSSIFEATIREELLKNKRGSEEGEISSNSSAEEKEKNRKKKHKHKEDKTAKKRPRTSTSLDKEEKLSKDKNARITKSPIRCPKADEKDRRRTGDTSKSKYGEDHRSKNDFYKDRKSKTHEDHKHHKHRENSFYKAESDDRKYSSHERDKDNKWFTKDRYRGYNEHEKERDRNHRGRPTDRDGHIDKKKLLEIARRNAIQMMKSGGFPSALSLGRHAQEKVLAALKAGGKTIEELTDFCKSLTNKEEMGEFTNLSDGEDGIDSDVERAFHHPFQLKDRPNAIVMNIKNSVPLPTKTSQERNAELRIQFPVSSGTQHRKTEGEWVPVPPKKTETPTVKPSPPAAPEPLLAIEAPPVVVTPPEKQPGPQVFPQNIDPNMDISSIVTQRLSAMRKLQENPFDMIALTQIHRSTREMQTWAESKQQPGQFTGSTGANILSQAELAAGFQAWAKKDQLQNAAPVSGGMGMHLLKKMGWNPGEGLGKEKTGALEPLLLEVKFDKKGLVANEEQKRKQQRSQKHTVKTLEGKHPVSLLGEFTAKRKLGAPQYTLCLESGPDHKKLFLYKVAVNGMECQSECASPNKKQAKADAAKLCLQRFGLLI